MATLRLDRTNLTRGDLKSAVSHRYQQYLVLEDEKSDLWKIIKDIHELMFYSDNAN